MTRLRLLAIGAALIAVLGVLVWFYQTGARSGADRVIAKGAKDHAATVAEARTDERQAAASTATIAARAARADDLTDRYVRQTIEELRHAISDAPAAAGDTLPAADVDSVRNRLNAATDRANRAADPAAPAQ
ncbi:hypothetical protein [Sphingomonas sanguinis]|uniref:Uncharacterized protein n=1 Tax=Sphingomonas sanguinis TaxID=33051 RepID=A0A147IXL3_9SPHN|nr:hypothetical protein [Sphingomonas sanguinis]KTW00460.1 hypothetical protein SB4_07055 [Sphingomonas sanguinis]